MRVLGSALALCLLATNAMAAVTFNFAASDGGFTEGGSGLWEYNGSAWIVPGSVNPTQSFLDSPGLTVDASGDLVITLNHSYNTDEPGDFFDGGIFQASINGGAFSTIVPSGGYPMASRNDGCDSLGFQPCWGGDSGGQVTDTLTITGLAGGDSVVLRLLYGTDHTIDVAGTDWTVFSISATNSPLNPAVIPLPATLPLLLGGLAVIGFVARGRRPG